MTATNIRNADGRPIVYLKPALGGRGHVVICSLGEGESVHPYVVWWMDVDGHTFSGTYCLTLEEAVEAWEKRK